MKKNDSRDGKNFLLLIGKRCRGGLRSHPAYVVCVSIYADSALLAVTAATACDPQLDDGDSPRT